MADMRCLWCGCGFVEMICLLGGLNGGYGIVIGKLMSWL